MQLRKRRAPPHQIPHARPPFIAATNSDHWPTAHRGQSPRRSSFWAVVLGGMGPTRWRVLHLLFGRFSDLFQQLVVVASNLTPIALTHRIATHIDMALSPARLTYCLLPPNGDLPPNKVWAATPPREGAKSNIGLASK